VTEKGSDIQATLADMTGQRTVPNIFISGQHIGMADCLYFLSFHSTISGVVEGDICPPLFALFLNFWLLENPLVGKCFQSFKVLFHHGSNNREQNFWSIYAKNTIFGEI